MKWRVNNTSPDRRVICRRLRVNSLNEIVVKFYEITNGVESCLKIGLKSIHNTQPWELSFIYNESPLNCFIMDSGYYNFVTAFRRVSFPYNTREFMCDKSNYFELKKHNESTIYKIRLYEVLGYETLLKD